MRRTMPLLAGLAGLWLLPACAPAAAAVISTGGSDVPSQDGPLVAPPPVASPPAAGGVIGGPPLAEPAYVYADPERFSPERAERERRIAEQRSRRRPGAALVVDTPAARAAAAARGRPGAAGEQARLATARAGADARAGEAPPPLALAGQDGTSEGPHGPHGHRAGPGAR